MDRRVNGRVLQLVCNTSAWALWVSFDGTVNGLERDGLESDGVVVASRAAVTVASQTEATF